jgi:hypothetical protein
MPKSGKMPKGLKCSKRRKYKVIENMFRELENAGKVEMSTYVHSGRKCRKSSKMLETT